MNVSELILKLQTLPQDSEVILKNVDPSDYTYLVPIKEEDITFEEEAWTDDDCDRDFRDVVVINVDI